MRFAIVTGASRGLGEAVVRQLLDKEVIVFSISRSRNTELEELAKESETLFYPFSFDLTTLNEIEELMEEIFSLIDVDSALAIYLINNAGIVDPIKPIAKADANELIENVHVNLLAPMLITSSFLKHASCAPCEKRIINISSGAGKKPYYGWGAYCTSKAGIDMFTQCVAAEEEGKEYPTKMISFAPGVVDTGMQAKIRNTNKEDFTELDRFLALKEGGKLLSPEYVAHAVFELLESENFPHGSTIRINEAT